MYDSKVYDVVDKNWRFFQRRKLEYFAPKNVPETGSSLLRNFRDTGSFYGPGLSRKRPPLRHDKVVAYGRWSL